MTLAQSIFGLFLTTLLGGNLSASSAQSAQAGVDRAIGNWSFQSLPYRDDTCQMSGNMQIRRETDTDGLACSFIAIEACIGEDRWIVEQVCSVEHSGDQLAMHSSIINFIEADNFTGSYLPDHFVLNIESGSRMSGQIISSISASVTFVRQEEAVS